MIDRKFGASGNTVVIEEFMTGREVSVLSFVDGKTIRTMSSAQDHKRAKDNDFTEDELTDLIESGLPADEMAGIIDVLMSDRK